MKSGAVVYVKQLEQMRSFYRECFKMKVTDIAEDFCILESESLILSLVTVPEVIAATIHNSTPPDRRANVPVKLVFAVASIEDMRPIAAEMGGLVDPSATRWEFRGSTHCDAVDPEGNVIQLLEGQLATTTQVTTPADH